MKSCKILKDILAIAAPAALSELCMYLMVFANIFFIAHLDDPVLIAGLGIGNTIMNFISIAPGIGMSCALETLVSQANGAGNKHLCHLYLLRGRVILTCIFIPEVIIMLFGKSILLGLK